MINEKLFLGFEQKLSFDFSFSNKVCFMGQDKCNPNGMKLSP